MDRIAGAIRACERNAKVIKDELLRLEERHTAWLSRMECIKAAALRAMQKRGIKSLETPQNKFTVCRNGGFQPIELTGEPVPPQFVDIDIRMTLLAWRGLLEIAIEVVSPTGGKTPMMDEIAVGSVSRSASHCASKSGGTVSPAASGTGGPQSARNARMRSSASAFR